MADQSFYAREYTICVLVYKGDTVSQHQRPESSNNAKLKTSKVPRAEADRPTEWNKQLVTGGNYLEVLEMAPSRGRALVTWRGR